MTNVVLNWGQHFAHKFDLTPCQTILDVGCRQGELTAALAKWYPQQQWLGIDNQPASIEAALAQSSSELQFECQDALDLPYEEQFDAVVSFSCLFWIQNKQKAFQNILKALKPGGRAYLQFFANHGRPKNDRFIYQVASEATWQSYFKQLLPNYYEITLGECASLLHQAGFLIHHMEFANYHLSFDHATSFCDWLKTWAPHVHYLPSAKQDHFFKSVAEQYQQHYHLEKEAPIPYKEYVLEIICEKPPLRDHPSLKANYQYGHWIFTHREAQIIKHCLQGKSAKASAQELNVSAKTIEFHLAKIKSKLGCHRRSDIIALAQTHGFVNLVFDNKL